jgi:hypothetical protein
MGRIGLALKVLFSGAFAKQVATIGAAPAIAHVPAERKPVEPPKPVRSDAVTLLATLQREARLLDFFKEPIGDYSDAQIGAAVRDVHRMTNDVLDRMFAIQPLLDGVEGSTVNVPGDADAGQYKFTGNVGDRRPDSGELMHHGWRATKCDLPKWTGAGDSALVIAPAEVEVKGS